MFLNSPFPRQRVLLYHDRAFDTLPLQFTSDIICIVDGFVEIPGVRRTSAAAVEFCETIRAFILGINIAKLEFVANICLDNTIPDITHQEFILTDKLVTWI